MDFKLETFQALSSPTRLKIISKLKKRRHTLTELSKLLNMHVSTVKEHLDKLESSGFIQLEDEGYKWKYYNLTKEGKNLISPYNTEIKIILPVSVCLILVGTYNLINIGLIQTGSRLAQSKLAHEAAISMPNDIGAIQTIYQIPTIPISSIILGVFLLGLVIGLKINRLK